MVYPPIAWWNLVLRLAFGAGETTVSGLGFYWSVFPQGNMVKAKSMDRGRREPIARGKERR
jgi:hypothetical protein